MIEMLSEHPCFGGVQRAYRHLSSAIGQPMCFSVYLPPQAVSATVPALYYLAGQNRTEENAQGIAGAQSFAALHGIALIAPDTGLLGNPLSVESTSGELREADGIYLDASQAAWQQHHICRYIGDELYALVLGTLPVKAGRIGIFGHGLGGHWALVLALQNPERFRSVTAFAPIAAPSDSSWWQKTCTHSLGDEQDAWQQFDTKELMLRQQTPFPSGILIDQGVQDQVLTEQPYPDTFEVACDIARQPLTLRRHPYYNNTYDFISTYIADHLAFHAGILGD